MNDTEHPRTSTDSNDGVTSSGQDSSVDPIEKIAAEIAAGPSGAARTAASMVRRLRPVIARARRDGIGWAHIAATLRDNGILATDDAVRMAYSRIAKQQRSDRPSIPPLASSPASRPDPVHSAPRFSYDPTSSSSGASGGRHPSIAKRAK